MNANPLSTVDAPPLGSDADVESFMIEYYGAWQGTDEDRIMSYYAENVTVQIPGTLMQGRSAVREQFVRPFITGFPGNRHFVKNMIFGRNVVIVEFAFDAQHKGPFAGRAATDAHVQVAGCGVYEYDLPTRQITTARIYFDVGTLLKQLLDPSYPQVTTEEAAAAPTGPTAAPTEHLDLATVITVSQTVSGEMVLERLLDTLMRTAVKHAGAERALLILSREVEQRIAAEATTSNGTVMVHLCDEPVTGFLLPESVLRYVLQTRESVILDDAAVLNPFSTDPYIAQRHARSVFCLPLTNQAKLIGLLYLENNLAPCVFAPARTAVLKLLASQAAISLENTRLYRELKASETELRRAHTHLTEAQRLSQTGSFTWDVQADDHTWSAETYRIFGFKPGVKVTIPMIQAAIHPEDMPAVEAVLGGAAEGADFDLTFRIIAPTGTVRHAHVVGHRDEQIADRPVFMGAVQDVTASKTAEKALRASERNARLIVDSIPGLIGVFTSRGEVELVNRQMLEYFGKTSDELKHWETSDAIHPEDRPRVLEVFAQSMASDDPFDVELRLRRFDGVYRWHQSRAFPLRNGNGGIDRWYNLITDIDERKRAEQALKVRESKIRRLVDANILGICIWNLDGAIVEVNEAFLQMLQYGREDVVSGRLRWTNLTPAEWREQDERAVAELRSTGSFQPFEKEYFRKDGSRMPVLLGGALFEESRNEGVAFVLDLSDQKRAEAEIRALKDQLYRENLALRDEVDRASMFEEIIGSSQTLKTVLSRIARVAPSDSTVFISGETGTGKELIARAVHKRSQRSRRAFVSVNCAALAPTLIPSELFGHEKGAFTGATQRRLGRFELADGGTIFLDEVGELLPDTQVALLRVLQEREFERVGGTQSIHVDVRVIAATNRDLKAAIAKGSFRQDLFYIASMSFPLRCHPSENGKTTS
jgi:PAS domain S-box-containing protein